MLLRTTRIASLVGCAIGVMVGCLIGMFPLWFMPNPEVVEAVKRKEKVRKVLDSLLDPLNLPCVHQHVTRCTEFCSAWARRKFWHSR